MAFTATKSKEDFIASEIREHLSDWFVDNHRNSAEIHVETNNEKYEIEIRPGKLQDVHLKDSPRFFHVRNASVRRNGEILKFAKFVGFHYQTATLIVLDGENVIRVSSETIKRLTRLRQTT